VCVCVCVCGTNGKITYMFLVGKPKKD